MHNEGGSQLVLVTGGAGFIGSHLVDLFLARGYRVRVLDNLSTGKLTNLPAVHPHLSFVEGDIRDAETVDKIVAGVTAIVHLAAVASVQASVDDPVGTHQVNLVGTLNLLEAARAHGIRRFVFASSAAVYGNVQALPVTEHMPLLPLTPYAADKLASEYYIDFYRRQHGLDPVIFRFFNIFGPRQDPSSPYSGVISIFMERAIAGRPITVFGDGEQSRDFVYVADLVTLLLAAVEHDRSLTGPLNVGNGQATNLNQLLRMIENFSGAKSEVTYVDTRPGDICHSLSDNSRIIQDLNYVCRHPVAEGLKQTFAWYADLAHGTSANN